MVSLLEGVAVAVIVAIVIGVIAFSFSWCTAWSTTLYHPYKSWPKIGSWLVPWERQRSDWHRACINLGLKGEGKPPWESAIWNKWNIYMTGQLLKKRWDFHRVLGVYSFTQEPAKTSQGFQRTLSCQAMHTSPKKLNNQMFYWFTN